MKVSKILLGSLLALSLCACDVRSPTAAQRTQSSVATSPAHTNAMGSSSSSVQSAASDEPQMYDTQTGTLSVTFVQSGAVLVGSPTAPTTLTEVLDYGCEYCRQFQGESQPILDAEYLRTGKMNMLLLYYPLTAASTQAAKAALCSVEQGKYLDMHARLLREQNFSDQSLLKAAKDLQLDTKKWKQCLSSTYVTNLMVTHAAMTAAKNVTRVPAFFMGNDAWTGLLSPNELAKRMMKQEL